MTKTVTYQKKAEDKNAQVSVTADNAFQELSISEVEDRLAFANAARCDISLSSTSS